jgi:hypothetical protein
MFVWNDFDSDDRIQKKALTLATENNVVVKCVCKKPKPIHKKRINKNLVVKYYWFNTIYKWFWNRLITNESFWSDKLEFADIYDCNDPDTLSAGVRAKSIFPSSKLIYDSHEYWKGTRRKETNLAYTLYSYIGNTIQYLRQEKYIEYADKVICVSQSIKNLLIKKYNKPTYVIYNYSKRENTVLDFTQKNKDKQVVFVGSKFRLGVTKYLDYFVDNGYKVVVIGSAKKTNPKIDYKGFIPKSDYMKILNKSCIGIAYMDITCDNIKYALPNKLFEYIQAGVIPIVNINNLDAANLVNKYKLGLVDNSDKKINSLPILSSDHFINYCQNNLVKYRNELIWEVQEDKLLKLYK